MYFSQDVLLLFHILSFVLYIYQKVGTLSCQSFFLLGMENTLKLPTDLLLWFNSLSSYYAVLVEGLTRTCA